MELGNFCIAYRQVFPTNRAIHQTSFDSVEDLHDAVCHSSTFPFFVTNWPVAFDAMANHLLAKGGRRDGEMITVADPWGNLVQVRRA